MIGIYKFENLLNGHCYIGQSVDIERRFKDHVNRAKNNFNSNSEYNSSFHRALRKYGLQNFSFIVLEECDKQLLNEREMYWIKYYNSYEKGYNETLGGDTQEATRKFNDRFILSIQNILLNTSMTYEEIHKKFNISLGRISEINTGKVGYNTNLSYPLRNKKKKYICSICGAEVYKGSKYCIVCANKQNRAVKERPNREELKTLIRTKTFVAIGLMYGVTDNAIRKWCKAENLPTKKQIINAYSDKEWETI